MAKENSQIVEEFLGLSTIIDNFQYSAVLGDSSPEVFSAQMEKFISLGFTDFKVKISGNQEKDNQKFILIRRLGQNKVRVRLDANNLWKESSTAIEYIKALNYPIFAVEEPLSRGQYEELKKISRECNVRIILDESFLKVEDFEKLNNSPSTWIINLRISKMGGLIRSLEIAKQAKGSGIGLIIGAQVGETSLLTRAALTIAESFREILIAQEGAFGTLLLQSDICDPPLMFGKKGILNFTPYFPYGFQLRVNLENANFLKTSD